MNWQEMVSKAVRYPWACRLRFHAYRWATPYAGLRRGFSNDAIWILQAGQCQSCGKVRVEERGPAHVYRTRDGLKIDAEINLDG